MHIKSIFKSRWLQGGAICALALSGSAFFYAVGGNGMSASYSPAQELSAKGFAADSITMPARTMAAPRAAAMDTAALAPEAAERRIQETQNFDYRAHRGEIEGLYDRAISACAIENCEVVNANLQRHDRMLYGQVSLRTDPAALPEYLESIAAEATSLTLQRHERSALDRTQQYEDTAARLRAQTALRDRLLALLDSASTKKTADILEIERELARTQAQIESLQSQVRSIEQVTDRMTVHLSFRSDEILSTPVEPPYLANAFREWKGIFERSAAGVVRVSASATPLLILAATIAGLVGIIRRTRRWIKNRSKTVANL